MSNARTKSADERVRETSYIVCVVLINHLSCTVTQEYDSTTRKSNSDDWKIIMFAFKYRSRLLDFIVIDQH